MKNPENTCELENIRTLICEFIKCKKKNPKLVLAAAGTNTTNFNNGLNAPGLELLLNIFREADGSFYEFCLFVVNKKIQHHAIAVCDKCLHALYSSVIFFLFIAWAGFHTNTTPVILKHNGFLRNYLLTDILLHCFYTNARSYGWQGYSCYTNAGSFNCFGGSCYTNTITSELMIVSCHTNHGYSELQRFNCYTNATPFNLQGLGCYANDGSA